MCFVCCVQKGTNDPILGIGPLVLFGQRPMNISSGNLALPYIFLEKLFINSDDQNNMKTKIRSF